MRNRKELNDIDEAFFQIPEADVSHVQRKWLDVSYANISEAQKLDIYIPEEGDGPFPVILNIHGGGFAIGDKRDIHLMGDLGLGALAQEDLEQGDDAVRVAAGGPRAQCNRPVIGVPVDASPLGGLDALLSTAQMPGGIPVATVALGKGGARTPRSSPWPSSPSPTRGWTRGSRSTGRRWRKHRDVG